MVYRYSSSTIFDRYALRFGGAFEVDGEPGAGVEDLDCYLIQSLMTSLARGDLCNRAGTVLRLNAGIVNDPDPNAFADRDADNHFIGVNLGHFLSAWYVSARLFRRNKTFHLIGEQPPDTPHEAVRLDAGAEDWASFLTRLHDGDLDQARREAAAFLRHVIVWFAVLHEWAHVTGGHCDLLASLGRFPRLQEVASGCHGGGISSVHYLLEYLADARAMKILTRQIATGTDTLTTMGIFGLSRTARQRLLLVGCGLMTAMWHSLNARKFGDDGQHPRPSTRFLHLIQIYRGVMEELGLAPQSAVRFVEIAVSDLSLAARHCPQLGHALSEAIDILRSGRPWDEHYTVRAADTSLGDLLDTFAFSKAGS